MHEIGSFSASMFHVSHHKLEEISRKSVAHCGSHHSWSRMGLFEKDEEQQGKSNLRFSQMIFAVPFCIRRSFCNPVYALTGSYCTRTGSTNRRKDDGLHKPVIIWKIMPFTRLLDSLGKHRVNRVCFHWNTKMCHSEIYEKLLRLEFKLTCFRTVNKLDYRSEVQVFHMTCHIVCWQ